MQAGTALSTIKDAIGNSINNAKEQASRLAAIAAVTASLCIGGCATVEPEYHTNSRDTNAAIAGALEGSAKNYEIYEKALKNGKHVDEYGRVEDNILSQHSHNWGSQVGGNIGTLLGKGRYVDPTKVEFKVNKGFKPDDTEQYFYVKPNRAVVTRFTRLPDEEAFNLSESERSSGRSRIRSSSNYSASFSDQKPTEILWSDVDGVLAAQAAERAARSTYQHGVLANPDKHDPTREGGYLDAIDKNRRGGELPDGFKPENAPKSSAPITRSLIQQGYRPDSGVATTERDIVDDPRSRRNDKSIVIEVRDDGQPGTPHEVILKGETARGKAGEANLTASESKSPEQVLKEQKREIQGAHGKGFLDAVMQERQRDKDSGHRGR